MVVNNIIYITQRKTPVDAYDYEGCDELRPIPIPTRPSMRRSFVPLDDSFLKKVDNSGPTWGMRVSQSVSQYKGESKTGKVEKVVLTYQRNSRPRFTRSPSSTVVWMLPTIIAPTHTAMTRPKNRAVESRCERPCERFSP